MLRRSSRVSGSIVAKSHTVAAPRISSSSDDRPATMIQKTKKRKREAATISKKSEVKKEILKEEMDIEDLGPPRNWQAQFEALREFRRDGRCAPVDTMGCDIHEHIDPKTKRLHCLISLMLSAQCKDEANALVMAHLKATLPRGLTLQDILEIEQGELALLIRPCGLHNNKAKYIKQTALVLRDEFAGDIPDSAEAMIRSLPGVGAKMAHLCMGSAWGQVSGIGVDTHVHRITNLLGWVKTNAPEKTRVALESWLPREYWREINHMLVGHGQLTCRPIGRRCEECPLSQEGLLRCPSVVLNKSPRKKVIKAEVTPKLEESQQTQSGSPIKQSYESRFPKLNDQGAVTIKVEAPNLESSGTTIDSLIPITAIDHGETGTELDGIKEEELEDLMVKQSPYFQRIA